MFKQHLESLNQDFMRKFQDFVVEKKIELKDDYNPCYYNFAQPI